jgi:hypothetical protein
MTTIRPVYDCKRARLSRLKGRRYFVWFDSHGEPLPVSDSRTAWRPVIYRPPTAQTRSTH